MDMTDYITNLAWWWCGGGGGEGDEHDQEAVLPPVC